MSEDTYRAMAAAIAFLEERAADQPTLDEAAAHVGYSPHHFQRLFRRWAGISPKRFVQYLTAEHARDLLRESHTVAEAAYGAGLSSPGRLHDVMVSVHATTPGEERHGGAGLTIRYGSHDTPFGHALFGATERGLSWLSFLDDTDPADELARLAAVWPEATLTADAGATAALATQVFNDDAPVPLHVRGTNFQVQVWQALLRIPTGAAVSYDDVAAWVGRPGASRAVGGAVARNTIAYAIPCHRVLRKTGDVGGYRWGPDRKQVMLAWEHARRTSAVPVAS